MSHRRSIPGRDIPPASHSRFSQALDYRPPMAMMMGGPMGSMMAGPMGGMMGGMMGGRRLPFSRGFSSYRGYTADPYESGYENQRRNKRRIFGEHEREKWARRSQRYPHSPFGMPPMSRYPGFPPGRSMHPFPPYGRSSSSFYPRPPRMPHGPFGSSRFGFRGRRAHFPGRRGVRMPPPRYPPFRRSSSMMAPYSRHRPMGCMLPVPYGRPPPCEYSESEDEFSDSCPLGYDSSSDDESDYMSACFDSEDDLCWSDDDMSSDMDYMSPGSRHRGGYPGHYYGHGRF